MSPGRKIKADRIMLAAPHSGSGKTFLTCGLLRLLRRRGLRAGAYKCGPDYIDPMFHREVLGVPSKNLDLYFSGEKLTRQLFLAGAEQRDISVMEGVMGFYDGLGGTELTASSYDLARATGTPVALVADGRGMSRSAVPLVKGFLEYRGDSGIAGVLLNRVSASSYALLKKNLEELPGIRVLGYVPPDLSLSWESRHLGLLQPEEIKDFLRQADALADIMEKTVDIPALLELASSAEPLEDEGSAAEGFAEDFRLWSAARPSRSGAGVRVGIARDEAFSFYYEDNLELLRALGAELIPFSPVRDRALPEVGGVILGGGYPELYGGELAENFSMREELRQRIKGGLPVLAECGGFLYLQESLKDPEGRSHPMVGALPGRSEMSGRPVRFGYLELCAKEGAGGGFLLPGERIRGHEFHYYDSDRNGDACRAEKPVSGRSWDCMVLKDNVAAGFPHLFYPSNPKLIYRFLERCASYSCGIKPAGTREQRPIAGTDGGKENI